MSLLPHTSLLYLLNGQKRPLSGKEIAKLMGVPVSQVHSSFVKLILQNKVKRTKVKNSLYYESNIKVNV